MRHGPKDSLEHEIFLAEYLKADIQQVIHSVMKDQGVTRKLLAERLSCSQAYITQLLDDDANLTLETIARVFAALDDEPVFSSSRFTRILDGKREENSLPDQKASDSPRSSAGKIKLSGIDENHLVLAGLLREGQSAANQNSRNTKPHRAEQLLNEIGKSSAKRAA